MEGGSEAVAEGEGSEGRSGCRDDLGWDAHEGRDEKHGNLFERVIKYRGLLLRHGRAICTVSMDNLYDGNRKPGAGKIIHNDLTY